MHVMLYQALNFDVVHQGSYYIIGFLEGLFSATHPRDLHVEARSHVHGGALGQHIALQLGYGMRV